jgi:hypothetical protein
MKSQYLLPAIAAAIGFSIAWIAKPSSASAPGAPAAELKAGSKKSERGESSRPRSSSISERRPAEVSAGDFPLTDLAAQGPKTREEAKMLRLAEALGLSTDQQAQILKLIEETNAAASNTVPILEDLSTRGRKLEETLATFLDAEQLAKFEELRVRERENRIESRAQGALVQVIREIDLSPGQRDEALARLRQVEKTRIQTIPAAATLLLKTSVLPTGPSGMTVESLLALSHLPDATAPGNPADAQAQMVQWLSQKLEEKFRSFEGIFTPGQMGQYHAILGEERAIIDRMQSQSGK